MRNGPRRFVVLTVTLALSAAAALMTGVSKGQAPVDRPVPQALPQLQTGPIAAPRLVARGEGVAERPLALAQVQVETLIVGFLARTTTTLSFRNGLDRVLEGELTFPLPEGATVSGYALDVQGELVDGVPVEKQQARVAFEQEVRKGADPGLVEWVRGNNFRTRVWPIPARGTRTVRVSYVSDLVTQGAKETLSAAYHLPLRYPGEVGQFSLRIEVAKGASTPEIRASALPRLRFERFDERFVAETKATAVTLDEDVLVALPQVPRQVVSIDQTEDGQCYFALDDFPTPPATASASLRPKRVGILWDASLSRARADTERERAILARWLKDLGDVEVELTVFRDVPEKAQTVVIRNGDVRPLLERLEQTIYDGGTDLGALRLDGRAERYLLFSDGLGTLGEGLPAVKAAPLDALSGDAQADHGLLRHLAEESGGAYLNLARMSDDDAVRVLKSAPFSLREVEFDPVSIADVLPSGKRPAQGRVTLTGRLTAPEAQITLRYGVGTEPALTRTFILRRSEATHTGLVSRLWAEQKVAELAVQAERNHAELMALGRRFGIVTPGTSLMVLETLEQYLEHGIQPPKSRAKMYEAYQQRITQKEAQDAKTKKDKLETVVALWQKRVDWWQKKYDRPQVVTRLDASTLEESVMVSAPPEAPRPVAQALPPPAPALRAPTADGITAGAAPEPAKGKKNGGDHGQEPAAALIVKPWDPKTPYLTALKRVPGGLAYEEYLRQRSDFETSPAFFLDCADFFLNAGERELGLRILTDVVELKIDDARLLRVAAHRLQQIGELDRAITLFQKVKLLRPEEPQSPRDLALTLAARGDAQRALLRRDPTAIARDYLQALELLNEIVLGRWDGRFPEIEVVALMDANRLLAILEREKLPGLESVKLDPRLRKLLDLDLRIVLTWDTDQTDMDLWVTEPSGEKCLYSHALTAIGGMISRDFTGGYGPEEYLVRRALPGDYLIQANYYSSRAASLTGPTVVQAALATDFGRPNERREALTLRLSEARQVIDVGKAVFKKTTREP